LRAFELVSFGAVVFLRSAAAAQVIVRETMVSFGAVAFLRSAAVAQAIFRETTCNLYYFMFLIKPGSFQ
jgi:hypothetical protein